MMFHLPCQLLLLISTLSFLAIRQWLVRKHVIISFGETITMATVPSPSSTTIQQQFTDFERNHNDETGEKNIGYSLATSGVDGVTHDIASSDYEPTLIDDKANNEDSFLTVLSTVIDTSMNTNINNVSKKFNPKSRIITNDIPWYDNQNNIMETNKGGKITAIRTTAMIDTMNVMNKNSNNTQQINEQYYFWLGSLPSGHILIYKSLMLGSNSWTLAKKIKVDLPENKKYNELGNCQLRQHPIYCRNHIFCKGRMWFIQKVQDEKKLCMDNIHKNITIDPTIGTYELLPIPQDPSSLSRFNFAAQSTYQENHNLYLIVSRHGHENKGALSQKKSSRKMFIYKLNDQWTDFDHVANGTSLGSGSEIVNFEWKGRESPWMIKRNDTYYIFVSQTHGWKQSKTFFKRSNTMIGLKDAMEESVVMHPHDTRYIRSMGSQFRFVMEIKGANSPKGQDDKSNVDTDTYHDHNDHEVGIERWIFGGDRYPIEAPNYWDSKYGRHVIVPMNFIDGVPNVYWKK